jgi:DNA-directed RNA polymerase subunit RPC12/RpoP
MNDFIFGCPQCQRRFRVTSEFAGEIVQCPHCSQKVKVPTQLETPDDQSPIVSIQIDTKSEKRQPAAQASGGSSLLPASFEIGEMVTRSDSTIGSGDLEDQAQASVSTTKLMIDSALPPKFEVDDPTRIRYRSGVETKVTLPTADGGVQTVDNRLVTIEYKGQKYTLVALSPEEKRRRQLIVNIVSVIVALAAIMGTLWILWG